ncbi:MAG TPA: hydrogenase 4 subunit F, partial [Gammaproteobacteria bacterium]|nr:hydrogenase 4 subunit F [Gammaproteobacteria bacterium]
MTAQVLLLLIPALGVPVLAASGHRAGAGGLNLLFCAVTFGVSLRLLFLVFGHGPLFGLGELIYIDPLNVSLLVLTAFVGLTTALFSRTYMAHEHRQGRLSAARLRLYHAMYQGFLLAMLLALSANNLGLLWVAVEGATLSTVMIVSAYRTPEAVEAAWKYFILCGVGIALALFGTVLVYFAAAQFIQHPGDALLWTELYKHRTHLDPVVLSIAFVFLLVGYGTKVGLVPMHQWLPDAHSEGPTPMSAILSGLLLNVAVYTLVRFKMLVDGSLAGGAHHSPAFAGHLMIAFGLLSFAFAVFLIHRQRDIKRMYSYSSIEHMGLITFAFGIGTPLATFGALIHMVTHSLTKSAIFVTVGHATQMAGSQQMDRIRGLIRSRPGVGWGLLIATVAICGFPPFGVFTSEFLVLTATMKSWPWLTVPLVAGLVVGLAGLFR